MPFTGGGTLDRSDLESIHSRTERDPLFLNELVRLLGQERSVSWPNTSPQLIREVIGLPLDQLSEECNDVLTIASVIGRDVSEKLGHRWMQSTLLDVNQTFSRSTGRWDEAFEFGIRGLSAVPNEPRNLGDLEFTACDLGDYDKGDSNLDGILTALRNPTSPSLDYLLPYFAITISMSVDLRR